MSQPPKSVQDALLILVVAYLDPLVYVHIKVGRRRSSSSGSSSSSLKILPHVKNIFARWIRKDQAMLM